MRKLFAGLIAVLMFDSVLAQTADAPVLIPNRADPWVYREAGDSYYFTASVPEFDRIELRHASSVLGLAQAIPQVVWRKKAKGPMSLNIWAPELHRIDGAWYIYFAAGEVDKPFHIRTYVLKNTSASPLQGQWTELGLLQLPWDSFNLDATLFKHQGQQYLVWAQQDKLKSYNSALWIARLKSPTELATQPVLLTEPLLDWERIGYKVNEGPAVLQSHGKVFISYSASATDHHYAMGLLTAPADADLLDPASWHKAAEPVFYSNADLKRFGPGHNSFVLDKNGQHWLMLYHARNYKEIQGNPLADGNRHTRLRQLPISAQGELQFGQQLPDQWDE
ncbi:family 43 glycosylhydrolase [Rheinheimera sp.]|uniref:glycoside hydrolase family 43 protein n=1 Tax=Rheinheimera sp. TaxID=1869214 RepID=UPI00307D961E